jgi:hypothetical protein
MPAQTAIRAWASFGHSERALAILRLMYDDYLAGNKRAKPDRQSLNIVLSSFNKSNREDAPFQAEALFQHMKDLADGGLLDVQPDVFSYCSGKDSQLICCLTVKRTVAFAHESTCVHFSHSHCITCKRQDEKRSCS